MSTMAALEAERNRLAAQHEQDVRDIDELRDAYLDLLYDPGNHTKRLLDKAAEELDSVSAAFHRLRGQVEAQIRPLGVLYASVPDGYAGRVKQILDALREALRSAA